jgi:hypothetical protein
LKVEQRVGELAVTRAVWMAVYWAVQWVVLWADWKAVLRAV